VLGANGGALASMLPAFKVGFGGRFGGGSLPLSSVFYLLFFFSVESFLCLCQLEGRQWMPWIHIDDLISLLLFSMGNIVFTLLPLLV
jgi:NAD dependent epimerase/dehydratase family enzyme